jgi:hypothetical protein
MLHNNKNYSLYIAHLFCIKNYHDYTAPLVSPAIRGNTNIEEEEKKSMKRGTLIYCKSSEIFFFFFFSHMPRLVDYIYWFKDV